MGAINHARTVEFMNFRTGEYRVYPGDVWKEYQDGPASSCSWYTLVPIRRDGQLVPTRSHGLNQEVAEKAALLVKGSPTWEAAREAIQNAFPEGFPGMKY